MGIRRMRDHPLHTHITQATPASRPIFQYYQAWHSYALCLSCPFFHSLPSNHNWSSRVQLRGILSSSQVLLPPPSRLPSLKVLPLLGSSGHHCFRLPHQTTSSPGKGVIPIRSWHGATEVDRKPLPSLTPLPTQPTTPCSPARQGDAAACGRARVLPNERSLGPDERKGKSKGAGEGTGYEGQQWGEGRRQSAWGPVGAHRAA